MPNATPARTFWRYQSGTRSWECGDDVRGCLVPSLTGPLMRCPVCGWTPTPTQAQEGTAPMLAVQSDRTRQAAVAAEQRRVREAIVEDQREADRRRRDLDASRRRQRDNVTFELTFPEGPPPDALTNERLASIGRRVSEAMQAEVRRLLTTRGAGVASTLEQMGPALEELAQAGGLLTDAMRRFGVVLADDAVDYTESRKAGTWPGPASPPPEPVLTTKGRRYDPED